MSRPRTPFPALPAGLARREDDRYIAGVAGGVGRWLGVDPIVVRLSLVLLTMASGLGVVLYVVAWAVLPEDSADEVAARADGRATEHAIAFGLLTVGSLLLLRSFGVWFPDQLVWPTALAAIGAGMVWARSDDAERERWKTRAAELPGNPLAALAGSRGLAVRTVAGAILVIIGLGTLFATTDAFGTLGQVGVAVLATAGGLGLLLGPWVLRLWQQLTDERGERIRSEERADMAAHLHDSVLQTLALIQRSAGSPHDTVSLARRQERELRSWLYGDRTDTGDRTLASTLDAMVSDVEARHEATVDAVTVGDCPVDAGLEPLVQAVREAVVNAAVHSGTDEVSIYVEVEPDRVTAYVRDRGAGFDLAEVAQDRRGIADSIVGRMQRHGGTATIHTAPGEGTEVVLEIGRAP